jgi:hypothetical protein
MSLLMIDLTKSAARVITDTLATTPGGDPFLFVSKCAYIGHLEMAIAVTGVGLLGDRWRDAVAGRLQAIDMDMVDYHAPEILRAIWAEIESLPEQTTSTVYHVGYSPNLQTYSGYIYRSTTDFESEIMEPGFRLRPEPLSANDFDEDRVELAKRLRSEQATVRMDERIHIGGELVELFMEDRIAQFRKVHQFEDFDQQWNEMNSIRDRPSELS